MARDGGWLRAWIRIASACIPREERGRWVEEWLAELADVAPARRRAWAAGVGLAALRFRRDDVGADGWFREMALALRGLLRRPGFTAVAVLTLALGMGANTAIFSVVNGVLLRPLPYPDPDRLVTVVSAFPGAGFDRFWLSPPEYLGLQERSTAFATLGAYGLGQASVGGGDEPERVPAAFASATLLEALGASPQLGRLYTREEDLPGAERVVLLSHDFWRRAFGGDPSLPGRTVEVNGIPGAVIGVMPPGFDLAEEGIDVWLPLGLDPADRSLRASHYLYLVGRLAPGVSLERARADVEGVVGRWADEDPGLHSPQPENHPFLLEPLREDVVGDVRQALVLLLGAVGIVLLIACANVGNLLLARAGDRQKEVAVRVAMGAGRGRLLRQFLSEGLVLSLLGGALGLALAWLSLRGLVALGPGDIPRLKEISLDGRVLLFTGGVSLVAGVFFGVAPARHLRAAIAGALGDGGQRTTAGAARSRIRSALVASQVALAMVLAVGAGLLLRSFQELTRVDPGFDPSGVLTFELFLPSRAYPDAVDVLAFQERLGEALAASPGTEGVAFMTGLPPVRDPDANDTEFEGVDQGQGAAPGGVEFYQAVSTDYLEAMRIPVVRGRGFHASDGADAPPVALVNETLARIFFPGEDPIGRRLRVCCGDEVPWMEIVGVVADVKQAGLDGPVGTELYFHMPQVNRTWAGPNGYYVPRSVHVVVRTPGPPVALAAAAREAVRRLDRTLPLAGLRPLADVVAGSAARPRFLTLLLGGFASLALALAALGTYGVMSYVVAQRRREMGIRMALGAQGGTVRGLVLRQGLRVIAAGAVVGLAGAWALSGLLESLLFGVAPRDPSAFLAAPALLAAVATVAVWIPASRATRVPPAEVLRLE